VRVSRFSNNVNLTVQCIKNIPVTGDGGTELWLEPPLPPTGPLRGVLILTTVMKYIYVGWNQELECRIFFGVKNVFQITVQRIVFTLYDGSYLRKCAKTNKYFFKKIK
jgi:hypothetical protein